MKSNKPELINKINKKVLVISHDDLDGAGCVLVAKRVFEKVDYVNINLNNLDDLLENYLQWKNKPVKSYTCNVYGKNILKPNKYDYIFITDMCPCNRNIHLISTLEDLNIFVIDHHKTALERLQSVLDHYTNTDIKYLKESSDIREISLFNRIFVSICGSNGKLNSGTNFFLQVLEEIFNFKLIKLVDDYFKKVIKAIRYYDTWMWEDINFKRSNYLNIIFKDYGIEKFIDMYSHTIDMCIIQEANPYNFFDDRQMEIINNRLKFLEELYDSIDFYIIKNDEKLIAIFIYSGKEISYLCNKIIKEKNLDLAICVNSKNGLISLRSSKDSDIDVSDIAKKFNGGGHKNSSGYNLTNTRFSRENLYTELYVDILTSK